MMTSMPIDSLLSLGRAEQLAEQWSSLMQPDALQHWLPGVLCGIALTVATAKLQHFLVLPGGRLDGRVELLQALCER